MSYLLRIRIHNLKLRTRIRQKVSDPYGFGSTTTLVKSEGRKLEVVVRGSPWQLWAEPPGSRQTRRCWGSRPCIHTDTSEFQITSINQPDLLLTWFFLNPRSSSTHPTAHFFINNEWRGGTEGVQLHQSINQHFFNMIFFNPRSSSITPPAALFFINNQWCGGAEGLQLHQSINRHFI
jgi:hypothetical protein